MNMDEQINELFERYSSDIDKEDSLSRSKIDIIRSKIKGLDYDRMLPGGNADIMPVLLYEYATSLEKITGGRVSYKDVISKLTSLMGKVRIRSWKDGIDDPVNYEGTSVTSDVFKNEIRSAFGAQICEYMDENGELKRASIVYDSKNGNGINFDDLNDIRHTYFHEWTHVMELQLLKDINQETEVNINGRVFRDNLKKADGNIWAIGLSTREFGKNAEKYASNKNAPKRLMHNQITEGMVELIARKLMENVLGKDEANKNVDMTRYLPHTKVAQSIMNAYGEEETIATFITTPYDLVTKLESKIIDDRDALHYMSDFVNDQQYFGIIPEYSPRTFLFSKMTNDIIEMFGILKEDRGNFQDDWSIAEEGGVVLSNIDGIISKYATKGLNDDEKLRYDEYKKSYSDLIAEETEFYDTLEDRLKEDRTVSLESSSMKKFASDANVMLENENAKSALDGLTDRVLEVEKNLSPDK